MIDIIGVIASVICAIVSIVDLIRNIINDKKKIATTLAKVGCYF